MITGIVVALPDELTTLTSKRVDKGCCVFISDKILVTYSGTGPQNAGSGAELLLSKGATQLISWGCAAALSALLKPGDLILADKLIDADHIEIALNGDWHRSCKDLLSPMAIVYNGCLTESKSMVSSSTQKRQLQSITGAIALDMESLAIAKVAEQHGLPFLTIRAIVDPVTMNLPRAIEYAANDQGDIILCKLLWFLALHPFELPQLIKLAIHFNAAKKTLKLVAKQLNRLTSIPQSAHANPTR